MKKVSVIIPAYNKADYTVRTVESVIAQTYKNIEIIVIDDGSTDDTSSRLKIFGSKIIYLRKENGGACSARNLGIRKAMGEYLSFLDCDDIYYPDKISSCVDYLNNDITIGFVYTGANFIDENDKKVAEYPNREYCYSGMITKRLIKRNIICNSTVVARKECFENVDCFDEKIFIPADWDMWLRLSEKYKAGYINENLTGYRVSDTYTIHHLEKGLKEEIYILNKAFKRNNIYDELLKNISFANVYYRYGLMNNAKQNFNRSKQLFTKAFKKKPHNFKLLALFIISSICPRFLYLLLKRRVVV